MSLALTCSSCARKLRLNDRLAGKRIKCPTCQTVLLVPQPTPVVADGARVAPDGTRPRESDSAISLDALPPQGDSGEAGEPAHYRGELWRMKTVEGDYYGPVSRRELDNWFHDGRIDAQCQLLQVGSNQWHQADVIYPILASLSASDLLPVPRDSGSQIGEQIGEHSADRVAARRNGHHHHWSEERRAELRSGSTARSGDSKEVEPRVMAPAAAPLSDRSRLVAGLLALFLGTLGMHRIYLGYVAIGLIQLATLGGFGVWALVDAVRIFLGRTPDATGRRLRP